MMLGKLVRKRWKWFSAPMRLLPLVLLLLQPLSGAVPETALTAVLDAAREGEIGPGKLEPLAISPFCTPAKKELIAENWTALGETLRLAPGGLKMENREVRESFAALSFSVTPPVGLGPVTFHVYGLKKEGENWLVAPVEGSFANAGLDFSTETEKNRKELEDWMARERVTGLALAVGKREEAMATAIRESVDPPSFKKAGPEEAVAATLEAIADNQPLRVLRWTGFPERLGDDLEWDDLERTILKGMKLQDRQGIWENLRSPGLLFGGARFDGQGGHGMVEIGVLNPYAAGDDHFELLTFEVWRRNGLSRVLLPDHYANADEDPRNRRRFRREADPEEEKELAKRFRKDLAEKGPVNRFPTAEEAAKTLAPMLSEKPLRELASWFVWDSSLKDLGELMEFSRQWTRLYNRTDLRTGEPHLLKGKDKALLIILGGAAKGEKGLEFELVRLARDEKGWGIFIGPDEKWNPEGEALLKEFEALKKTLEADIVAPLTARLAVYQPEAGKVTPQAAADLLAAWRKGLQARDLEELLDLGAVLAEDQKGRALEQTMILSKIHREPLQTDFSVLTVGEDFAFGTIAGQAGPGADLQYDVVLMVPTKKGLRVLVSADLWYVTNKAKELRNQASLQKLGKTLPPEKSAVLGKLLTEHLKGIGEEIKKSTPAK